MEPEQIIQELRQQINELQQREIANCQQIEQLIKENLDLHQQAAQAKAYKKQIDVLLSDPFLVKIRMEKEKDDKDIEIESDSILEERNRILLQKLKEVSAERDKFSQMSTEQQFYQEQIEKKNRQIVELTEKLTTMTNNAEIFRKQLEEHKEQLDNMTENEGNQQNSDKIKLQTLEENNKNLNEILKEKVDEIGSLTAINKEYEIKNSELTRQLSEAQTMISLQQAENRMITEPSFDKESLAKRIQQVCERAFERADLEADKLKKRIKDLESKIRDFKPAFDNGESEKVAEQEEIIEELREQIRDLEENDCAPKLAPALAKIESLENEIKWLKSKQ